MEGRNLLQALPYFDRFDYVANLFQEHAFCLAVESLYRVPTHLTASVQLARLLFDEISRILNHLLTLSATALDLSVMGPVFWAFEEREALMELCEQASGARMHTALYRPFGFDSSVFTNVFVRELCQFLTRCGRSLAGAFLGLLNNRSFKSRLSYIGQVSLAKAHAYGVTGLIARSCGGLYDLRLQAAPGYSLYRELSLRVFLGRRGDNLDRFLLRVKEVSESFRLLSQLVQAIQPTPVLQTRTPLAVTLRVGGGVFGLKTQLTFLCDSRVLAYNQTTRFVARLSSSTSSVNTSHKIEQAGLSLSLEPRLSQGKFNSMESLIGHFRSASEG